MSKIIIDADKCKKCGICIETCPNKLIKYSTALNCHGNITAELEDTGNKCTGCGLCAIMCPEIAIKEVLR